MRAPTPCYSATIRLHIPIPRYLLRASCYHSIAHPVPVDLFPVPVTVFRETILHLIPLKNNKPRQVHILRGFDGIMVVRVWLHPAYLVGGIPASEQVGAGDRGKLHLGALGVLDGIHADHRHLTAR